MKTANAARSVFKALVWTPLLAAATLAGAQVADYPNRAITIIIAGGPGSATDNVVRPVALALQKSLGQPVIVDYRLGANGLIGTQMGAPCKARWLHPAGGLQHHAGSQCRPVQEPPV